MVSDGATPQPLKLHILKPELVQFTAAQPCLLATLWSQLFPMEVNLQMSSLSQTSLVRGEVGVHLPFIWLQPHALALRLHLLDLKEQTESSVSRALWGFERIVIP